MKNSSKHPRLAARLAIASVGLCAAALTCHASAEQTFPATEVEVSGERLKLSNNLADWHDNGVSVSRRFDKDNSLYAAYRETSRYGLDDHETTVGGYFKPAGALIVNLEGSTSDTHKVLAEHALLAQLSYVLGGGTVLNGGYKISKFADATAKIANLGVEQYVADWRLAYTLYLAKPDGAPYSANHRVQATRYFDDWATLGLSVSHGREVENVGGTRLLVSDVDNVTFSGSLMVQKGWWLLFDASRQRQGTLYVRQGARLGVKAVF